MGDYLDTTVISCHPEDNSTALLLSEGERTVSFKLPLSINLDQDDTISFYQGVVTVRNTDEGDTIDHSSYIRAEVYRCGRKNRPIFTFNSRDMRILSELRDAEVVD